MSVVHLAEDSVAAHMVLAVAHRMQKKALSERQELYKVLGLNPAILAARIALSQNLAKTDPPRCAPYSG